MKKSQNTPVWLRKWFWFSRIEQFAMTGERRKKECNQFD
jgi:hypothetical protein